MNLRERMQRLGFRLETINWKILGKIIVVKLFDIFSIIFKTLAKPLPVLKTIVFYTLAWWLHIPHTYAKKLFMSRNSYADNLLNFERYITATSFVGMITVFILFISQDMNEINWFYILGLVLLFQVSNFLGFLFTLLLFKVKYTVDDWKKELVMQKKKDKDIELYHLKIEQIERWEESERVDKHYQNINR